MEQQRDTILHMSEPQFREFIVNQLRAGEARFAQHQEMLSKNMALTKTTADNTAEIIEMFAMTKKGVRFFQRVGTIVNRAARWAAPILVAAGAVWAILHGQWPRGGE